MPSSSTAAKGRAALIRPAAADTDLVKAALANGGLRLPVSLVSRANLADTVGAAPVTVVMATDGAFARLTAVPRASLAGLSLG